MTSIIVTWGRKKHSWPPGGGPDSRRASIVHHLYPGVVITVCFVVLTPRVVALGYPPQFSMLLCIIGVAIPLLLLHLRAARKREGLTSIRQLNGYTERLPTWRLVSYSLGLVLVAFIAWGLLQPALPPIP